MKRLLSFLLATLFCLFAFSGCTYDREESNNTDPNVATDESSTYEETKASTESASNSELYQFPAEPPKLSVSDGKTTIDACESTYSWSFKNEDGSGTHIEADFMHPLEMIDHIPIFKVSKTTVLSLNSKDCEETPKIAAIQKYDLNISDPYTYENIAVTGNSIEVEAENNLYVITVEWGSLSKPYSGTVRYVFRTEK